MGIIKDGAISGVLPKREVFAVHYPGYPSSISRAVETLGGPEAVRKVRSSRPNNLELRFRPEDPYSHPAFGELRPCSSLLLKISKKKCCDDQDADVSKSMSKCSSTKIANSVPLPSHPESPTKVQQGSLPENEMTSGSKGDEVLIQEGALSTNICADIVARVSEAYHFNGMVDYQHVLAVHADVAKKRKRHWAEVEPHFEKGGLMDIDQEDLMILVPSLFSPKDVPEKLVLRPSVTLSEKKKQEGVVQHRWEMDIEPCIAIDFSIEEIPRKFNWEECIPQASAHWQWQMAVSKLFDERPIWHKHSLNQHLIDEGLKFGVHLLKRLLFRTAYYFSTGPFRLFWIRKGYDPRKDPESRIYQTIDFRVPPALRNFGDTNTTDELKDRWKDICSFRIFPCKNQTSLQLFDLVDDYIQEEIRQPSLQPTCTCTTGWFSPVVLDRLRFCIAVRFLSIYPKMGAQNFLKSASERFEKSKRMQNHKKDLRPDEEEHQHINRDSSSNTSGVSPKIFNDTELVCNDDKDEPDNDDYDDDDDEIEDEEEEDLDEFETLHVAGEDGDFSLQPGSYANGENISKNYLQELFGSFPSAEVGNSKGQDADYSDGEYQIYEQDSSDNDDC